MNRREFTTAIGAGLAFPVDLLASLAKQEVKSPKIAEKITIVCLGSDEKPATSAKIKLCAEVIDIVRRAAFDFHKTMEAMSHGLDLDMVIYEDVELDGLVFILKSEIRHPTDCEPFMPDVVDQIGGCTTGDTLIMHHGITLYRTCQGTHRRVVIDAVESPHPATLGMSLWGEQLKRVFPSRKFTGTKAFVTGLFIEEGGQL